MSAKNKTTTSDNSTKTSARDSFRETIESVAIAFILAFMFRTFEAEAFVIPTGSMAPTLMGRHKDVFCEQDDYEFFVGASVEVHDETGEEKKDWFPNPRTGKLEKLPETVGSATCPNSGHTMSLGPIDPAGGKKYYSYTGDRILVSKFAYQFADPQRWDVVVFKFPQKAQTNYIKRLVGLPGETLKLFQGDIYMKQAGEVEFTVARKPPDKVRAMMQTVYDNDYTLPELSQHGWKPRWSSPSQQVQAWQVTQDLKSFALPQAPPAPIWLRYQHFFPTFNDWAAMEAQPPIPLPAESLRPKLISDFCAYNTGELSDYEHPVKPPKVSAMGLHWVGDLVVDAELTVESAPGENAEMWLELVRAGEPFRCRLNLKTGEATLFQGSQELAQSAAPTAVQGQGSWELSFANVDRQLILWVDGSPVPFLSSSGSSVEAVPYTSNPPTGDDIAPPPYRVTPPCPPVKPTTDDLSPVGLAVQGVAAKLNHLRLWRDLYYTATGPHEHTEVDFMDSSTLPSFIRSYHRYSNHDEWADFHSNPSTWDAYRFTKVREMKLEEDQFLVLGDNSTSSADSRAWGEGEHYVQRDLLIGKALFIYWPHAWETSTWHKEVPIPFLGKWQLPFYPNFGRMRGIR